jgi:hypothetical protein
LFSRSNTPGVRLEVDVDAVGAASEGADLVVEEQVEHHLRERHRDHDEVDAVRADHEEADDQREAADASTASGSVHHRLTAPRPEDTSEGSA